MLSNLLKNNEKTNLPLTKLLKISFKNILFLNLKKSNYLNISLSFKLPSFNKKKNISKFNFFFTRNF
jgi:hypothetical protein